MVDERFQVSLGGKPFDPLDEQKTQEKNSDDAPKDPDASAAWIVQFQQPLAQADMDELRAEHGLSLSEYLPPRSYVEHISPRQTAKLRTDKRVRAVMRFLGDFKLARHARTLQANKDLEGIEPVAVDVVVFGDGDVETVLATTNKSGGRNARIIDDRPSGGGVVVRFDFISGTDLAMLAQLEDVRWIAPVPVDVDDQDEQVVIADDTAGLPSGILLDLHGEGQIIGLIDKGQPAVNHCFFRDPDQPTPGPQHRKLVQVRNALGTLASDHATFTAGIAAGDDVDQPGAAPHRGIAWATKLVCGNRLDLPNTSLFAQFSAAAEAGARIHSNSWHSRPQGAGNHATYEGRSAEVDNFSWINEDHLVIGSSGNHDEEQGPPGSAKNTICVSSAAPDPAAGGRGDGNPGPTADGRRKPDLTAIGCQVISALPGVVGGVRCKTGTLAPCASSFATPRVAGIAAIARQYFTEGFHPSGQPTPSHRFVPSGALLKAVLLNAVTQPNTGVEYPNDTDGWGFLDSLSSLVPTAAGHRLLLWDVRRAAGLSTGDRRAHEIDVSADDEPIAITLVWTDPPAPVGTDLAAVNDLDLVVTAPNGDIFLGNVLRGGVSVTGGEADRINNVERVIRLAPEPGRWQVEVVAQEVNVRGLQGYGLVASGRFSAVPQ